MVRQKNLMSFVDLAPIIERCCIECLQCEGSKASKAELFCRNGPAAVVGWQKMIGEKFSTIRRRDNRTRQQTNKNKIK